MSKFDYIVVYASRDGRHIRKSHTQPRTLGTARLIRPEWGKLALVQNDDQYWWASLTGDTHRLEGVVFPSEDAARMALRLTGDLRE